MKKFWRVWAKALGEKSGKSNSEADTIAKIRTFIFIQLVLLIVSLSQGTYAIGMTLHL